MNRNFVPPPRPPFVMRVSIYNFKRRKFTCSFVGCIAFASDRFVRRKEEEEGGPKPQSSASGNRPIFFLHHRSAQRSSPISFGNPAPPCCLLLKDSVWEPLSILFFSLSPPTSHPLTHALCVCVCLSFLLLDCVCVIAKASRSYIYKTIQRRSA